MDAVDNVTGRLKNIISFIDYRTFEPITHHPESGVDLTNFSITDWPMILEQVPGFQKKCPGLRPLVGTSP